MPKGTGNRLGDLIDAMDAIGIPDVTDTDRDHARAYLARCGALDLLEVLGL